MSILAHVLVAARRSRALVAFDLDSTLLDNRPRSTVIFREFGRSHGVVELTETAPQHFRSWNLKEAIVATGVSAERAGEICPSLVDYWRPRFFSSEYCLHDVPILGAASFVHQVLKAGASVAYVTGRHEAMRPGTEESFRRHGFPQAGPRTHLLMKPTFEMHDDAWKASAHAALSQIGDTVAAFDNEPMHINSYADAFPNAILVHLDTDHSGRNVALLPSVRSIKGFVAD